MLANGNGSEVQFTVTGRVKETNVNTETLSLHFNLGALRVVVVANIPGDGKDTAPAYVKLQLPDANGNYPRAARRHSSDASPEEGDAGDEG